MNRFKKLSWYMPGERIAGHPSQARLVAAFAAVYLLWGSTYLAIEWAVMGLPPFFMAGARFIIAGAMLYIWARLNGAARPDRINWATATLVGGLLFLAGNGTLVWVEKHSLPSYMAALFIATEPLWIVLINWLWPGGARPSRIKIFGIVLGLVGIVLLYLKGWSNAEISDLIGNRRGAILLILAAFFWALGSIISSKGRLPASSLLAAAMQMLMGGALLLITGLIWERREVPSPGSVPLESFVALVYLIIFGSIIAFASYNWLLKVSTPSRASSFAYVNPVVAVLVGWVAPSPGSESHDEQLTPFILVPVSFIVVAVAIVTGNLSFKRRRKIAGLSGEENQNSFAMIAKPEAATLNDTSNTS